MAQVGSVMCLSFLYMFAMVAAQTAGGSCAEGRVCPADVDESEVQMCFLQHAFAIGEQLAVSQTARCESWCSAQNCDFEGGATCGMCEFCPIFGTSCDARYLRLEKISNQEAWHVPESDPQFPPDMRSIADPSKTCGDSAQGIKNSCSMYNTWKTFQEVAKVSSSQAVRVIGPSGVQHTDIGQGALGTCYFLAALASVAYNQPKMIEDMFPASSKDLYGQNIYTTRWWLNGKEQLLSVDNQVPASYSWLPSGTKPGKPFFTGLSPTQEFWPLILEKTWAKIAGAYKSVESGGFEEVMMAITRAPIRTIKDIKTDAEKVWAALVGATAQKSPQAAWCEKAAYGLHQGHVYAVLTAEERASGRAVKVYNPWRHDYYDGSLKAESQTQGDGTFWMTLSEFQQAFSWYQIADVITDYKTMGYHAVPGNKATTVSMTVSSEEKFIVSLNWPQGRILRGATCKDTFSCQTTMTVCKDNGAGGCADGSVVTGKRMEGSYDGLLFATMDSGSGTYIASITSEYEDTFSFIKELSVTVYSDSTGGAVPMTTAAASNPAPAPAPPSNPAPTGCAVYCTNKYWCDYEEGGGRPCATCAFC